MNMISWAKKNGFKGDDPFWLVKKVYDDRIEIKRKFRKLRREVDERIVQAIYPIVDRLNEGAKNENES